MSSAEKIAKIRTLAERGATEGERAAAREALKRIGEAEAPEVQDRMAYEVEEAIVQNGSEWWRYFAFGATQSTNASHNGRVWYDVS